MELKIMITVSGTSLGEQPGPGGWAAAVQIPQHHPIRVSGSDPGAPTARMRLTALVRGLAELHALANVEGVPLEIISDSRDLLQALDRWLRTGEHEGEHDLWKELGSLSSRLDFRRMQIVNPMDRNIIMEECIKKAVQEAQMASAHPQMEPQLHRSDQGEGSPQDQEFDRNYQAGYEAQEGGAAEPEEKNGE